MEQPQPDLIAEKFDPLRLKELFIHVAKLRTAGISQAIWETYLDKKSIITLYPYLYDCMRHSGDFSKFEGPSNSDLGWKDYLIAILHNQEPVVQKLIYSHMVQFGYPLPLAYKLKPENEDFNVSRAALEFLEEHSDKGPVIVHNLLENVGEVLPKIFKVPLDRISDDKPEYMDLYNIPFDEQMRRRITLEVPVILVKLQPQNMSKGICFLKEELKQQYSAVVAIFKVGEYVSAELVSAYRKEGIKRMIICVARKKVGTGLKIESAAENSNDLKELKYEDILPTLRSKLLAKIPKPDSEPSKIVSKLQSLLPEAQEDVNAKTPINLAALVSILESDTSLFVLPKFYLRYAPKRCDFEPLYATIQEISAEYTANLLQKPALIAPHYEDIFSKLLYVSGNPMPFWGWGRDQPMNPVFLHDILAKISTDYIQAENVGVITVAGGFNGGEKARLTNAIFGTHFDDISPAEQTIFGEFATTLEEGQKVLLILNLDCSFAQDDVLAFFALISDILVTYHPSEPCRDTQVCYTKIAERIEADRAKVGVYDRPILSMLTRGKSESNSALNQMVAMKKNLREERAPCLSEYFVMDDTLQLTLPEEATYCFSRAEITSTRKLFFNPSLYPHSAQLMKRFAFWTSLWDQMAPFRGSEQSEASTVFIPDYRPPARPSLEAEAKNKIVPKPEMKIDLPKSAAIKGSHERSKDMDPSPCNVTSADEKGQTRTPKSNYPRSSPLKDGPEREKYAKAHQKVLGVGQPVNAQLPRKDLAQKLSGKHKSSPKSNPMFTPDERSPAHYTRAAAGTASVQPPHPSILSKVPPKVEKVYHDPHPQSHALEEVKTRVGSQSFVAGKNPPGVPMTSGPTKGKAMAETKHSPGERMGGGKSPAMKSEGSFKKKAGHQQ